MWRMASHPSAAPVTSDDRGDAPLAGLDLAAPALGVRGGVPREQPHRMTRRQQRAHRRGADDSRSSRDQNFHG